jgi:hypothetical protein
VRRARGAGPEVGEDLVDHRGLRDERDAPHGPATRRTRERVDLNELLQEGRPSAGGLGRRESWRGNDRGRPVRGGGRRLPPHTAGAIRIPTRGGGASFGIGSAKRWMTLTRGTDGTLVYIEWYQEQALAFFVLPMHETTARTVVFEACANR